MRIISLSLLSIALSVALFARSNPFEPTDHFLEQKEILIKANELEQLNQEEEKKKIVIQSEEVAEVSIPEPLEEIKKEEIIAKVVETFKTLSFVDISVVDDVLTIKVDTKYTLLNQDILKPTKKLLFDFKGKESFYTIRKDIKSDDFVSLTLGTHLKENFFRIVVNLPEEVSNYIETVDGKNGIITIKKK